MNLDINKFLKFQINLIKCDDLIKEFKTLPLNEKELELSSFLGLTQLGDDEYSKDDNEIEPFVAYIYFSDTNIELYNKSILTKSENIKSFFLSKLEDDYYIIQYEIIEKSQKMTYNLLLDQFTEFKQFTKILRNEL